MDEWKNINEQIKRSKIRRYNWKGIFGMSLTEFIIRLREKGHNSDEVYQILCNNPNLKKFCENNPLQADKVHDNIKISVSARFGENNSAQRIKQEVR